ncbi:hypothetical protein [Streptomyces sp. NPDC002889]|uniref:hypothetical protein n=1 Tax=Streptomyces sp. NPDC002889 TaxID=3364669 RepID=UPI0036748DC1
MATAVSAHRLPKDRGHIFGHIEVPGAARSDPAHWSRRIRLVNVARRTGGLSESPAWFTMAWFTMGRGRPS